MAVDDSFTKALLHMDGADASTTFTDESGKTWTAQANAQIDTAQSVFGGASGLFDGTGDFVSTPDHADWAMGVGDFTVDLRARMSAVPALNTYYLMFCQGDFTAANNWTGYFLNNNGTEQVGFYSQGAGINWNINFNYAADTWYHIAWVRDGTDFYIFVDGNEEGTMIDADNLGDSGSTMCVGADTSGAFEHTGWIDEVRISKGVARWTSGFTPPTAPYGVFLPKVMNIF